MIRGNRIIIAVLICLAALFFSCDGLLSGITPGLFYEAVEEVAPEFASGTSRATWDNGGAIYELYGILKGDGEPVGYFNLYGLMETADEYFSSICTSLNTQAITLQEVALPDEVDLGFNGTDSAKYSLYYDGTGGVFTMPHKSYAYVDGTSYRMLVVSESSSGLEDSKFIVQGTYDESTHLIDIRMFSANYETEGGNSGWENVIAKLSGNTETHTFTISVIRDGIAYDHNIIGYGVSEGSGYFLMHLTDNEFVTSGAYFEFDASQVGTLSYLQGLSDTGSSTVPANTADYSDELDAITPMTTADLPTQAETEALTLIASVSHS